MKRVYGIPAVLDATMLDMNISIRTDSGLAAKPLPLRNLLFILGGIMGCFLIISKTFVSRGTLLQKGIFIVLWAALCALLLTSAKTKELGFQRLLSVFTYMQPQNRYVNTRRVNPAGPFAGITGFSHMDPDTGVIYYLDGSRGMLFDVIGNGSVLLFDEHKEQIIDRVDAHYRKMRPGTTYHFVTVKQPQEVVEQLRYLDGREDGLTTTDPDLTAMYETDRYVLSKIVGSTYKSLHQYLLMQAKNDEELKLAYNVLVSEVENSALMFKRVVLLGEKEASRFFAGIYSGKEEA